jgi:hypothetical protein
MIPKKLETRFDIRHMFIHRKLLEYFAARYVEPGTSPGKDISSANRDLE